MKLTCLVMACWALTFIGLSSAQEATQSSGLVENSEKLAKMINEANLDGVLSLFHKDAVFIDEAGQRYQGTEELEKLFKGFFEAYPKAKMQLDSEEIQAIGDDLAIKEGRRVITTEDGAMAVVKFNTLLRKVDDQWLIVTIKEQPAEDELVPGVRLEPLGWLVGEWINEGADAKVNIKCDWSPDGNYLLIDYQVVSGDEIVLNSHQRIGWDPQAKKIRSWLFDSDGGYGQGFWTLLDDRWVVKSTAVLPNGQSGSATFIYDPESEDKITLYGVDRVIGDALEGDFEVTMVRKPPKASAK